MNENGALRRSLGSGNQKRLTPVERPVSPLTGGLAIGTKAEPGEPRLWRRDSPGA